jgi:hypothetical protein
MLKATNRHCPIVGITAVVAEGGTGWCSMPTLRAVAVAYRRVRWLGERGLTARYAAERAYPGAAPGDTPASLSCGEPSVSRSSHWRLEPQRLREIGIRNRAKLLGTVIAMGGIALAFAYLWFQS